MASLFTFSRERDKIETNPFLINEIILAKFNIISVYN